MPVSFLANLKIDDNFGKNCPSFIDKKSLEDSITEYKEFLNNDTIKKLTEGDTVVMSTKRTGSGYCVDMDFYEKGKEEPVNMPVCMSKGTSGKFRSGDFAFCTEYFIALKSGEQPRLLENSFRYIKRGIQAYINKLLQEKNL